MGLHAEFGAKMSPAMEELYFALDTLCN
jgi:hypothetical protein